MVDLYPALGQDLFKVTLRDCVAEVKEHRVQDHCFIKRVTAPMMGFKAFHSAAATIAGIETAHMIREGPFGATGLTAFQQFAQLAA